MLLWEEGVIINNHVLVPVIVISNICHCDIMVRVIINNHVLVNTGDSIGDF